VHGRSGYDLGQLLDLADLHLLGALTEALRDLGHLLFLLLSRLLLLRHRLRFWLRFRNLLQRLWLWLWLDRFFFFFFLLLWLWLRGRWLLLRLFFGLWERLWERLWLRNRLGLRLGLRCWLRLCFLNRRLFWLRLRLRLGLGLRVRLLGLRDWLLLFLLRRLRLRDRSHRFLRLGNDRRRFDPRTPLLRLRHREHLLLLVLLLEHLLQPMQPLVDLVLRLRLPLGPRTFLLGLGLRRGRLRYLREVVRHRHRERCALEGDKGRHVESVVQNRIVCKPPSLRK
jgi:hypothetical protein